MNPDQNNPQPAQPTPPSAPMAPIAAPKKSAAGVVILVIVLVVLLGLGYFLMPKGYDKENVMAPSQSDDQTSAQVVAADPNAEQGSSSDISEIEADLNSTDFDSIEADVQAI